MIASDRPAKEIKSLEERLRTRFEWGLTADVQPPDFETRVALVKRKAALLHLDVYQRQVKLMRRGFFKRSVIIREARSMVSMNSLVSMVTRVRLPAGMTLR